VSELFCGSAEVDPNIKKQKLDQKIDFIKRAEGSAGFTKHVQFSDFGTRRRYSKEWQSHVVQELTKWFYDSGIFMGTSNVGLAMRYNIKPIGTMAHEFLQAFQQLTNLKSFQRKALLSWHEEYQGQLGIALSDVVGFDAFLKDFDFGLARMYEGARHDSGDPYEWCQKLIDHYHKLNVDPMTKTAVFSDGLDVDKMEEISSSFYGAIQTAFGIGTNLTNDVGLEAPQIVIKMTKCNDGPVAKISDSKGKGMCKNENFLSYLKETFEIEV
jgi:nicotinate phosphoribosyltransferase